MSSHTPVRLLLDGQQVARIVIPVRLSGPVVPKSSPPGDLAFAIFYSKVHDRLLRPLLAADQPPAPPPIRNALRTIDIHITKRIDNARLPPIAAWNSRQLSKF